MSNSMSNKEFLAYTREKKKKRPGQKYNNKKTVYNGFTYDSKREAEYAMKLDKLIETGEVLSYEKQVRYDIHVKDKYIAFYKADFVVKYKDGREEVVDIKGLVLPIFKLKKKLVEVIHGIEILVIK